MTSAVWSSRPNPRLKRGRKKSPGGNRGSSSGDEGQFSDWTVIVGAGGRAGLVVGTVAGAVFNWLVLAAGDVAAA